MSHSERKPRILVVDDDEFFTALVVARLGVEGMQAIQCVSGRQAIDMVEAQPLDAVVLDIGMPDVDGYQVLQHIRSTPATAHLPVVVLTGHSTLEDVEKGLAMGANYYLEKPFNGPELVVKLRLCFENGIPSRTVGTEVRGAGIRA